MNWFDKESSFESRTNRAGDIWRYIPKSKYESISDARIESDGYWIYLNDGFTAYDGGEDCGIIHEFTVADLREAIKTIYKKG